jgi:hypothetical protein
MEQTRNSNFYLLVPALLVFRLHLKAPGAQWLIIQRPKIYSMTSDQVALQWRDGMLSFKTLH